jgi:hypothetical protein
VSIALYRLRGVLLTVALLLVPTATFGQAPKSAALAAELARLMDQAKVDSIAAKHPTLPDSYIGALYFAGSQLLVVEAKYSVPQLLDKKLESKEYRDVYIDLNSASVPDTKIFISDLGADGLKPKREENQPFDTVELRGKSYSFDGDWRRAKLTEEEYMKQYQQAEQEYEKMLEALLGQLKKTS